MQTPASLTGCEVYAVTFTCQTALEMSNSEDSEAAIPVDAQLTIFTPFVLRSADGTTHHLDPETSRAALGPVIDLLEGTITGATIDGNDTVDYDAAGNPINALGTLILDFADGAQLTVPPHANLNYEPWMLEYRDEDDDKEPDWWRDRPRLNWSRLPGRLRGRWQGRRIC